MPNRWRGDQTAASSHARPWSLQRATIKPTARTKTPFGSSKRPPPGSISGNENPGESRLGGCAFQRAARRKLCCTSRRQAAALARSGAVSGESSEQGKQEIRFAPGGLARRLDGG